MYSSAALPLFRHIVPVLTPSCLAYTQSNPRYRTLRTPFPFFDKCEMLWGNMMASGDDVRHPINLDEEGSANSGNGSEDEVDGPGSGDGDEDDEGEGVCGDSSSELGAACDGSAEAESDLDPKSTDSDGDSENEDPVPRQRKGKTTSRGDDSGDDKPVATKKRRIKAPPCKTVNKKVTSAAKGQSQPAMPKMSRQDIDKLMMASILKTMNPEPPSQVADSHVAATVKAIAWANEHEDPEIAVLLAFLLESKPAVATTLMALGDNNRRFKYLARTVPELDYLGYLRYSRSTFSEFAPTNYMINYAQIH